MKRTIRIVVKATGKGLVPYSMNLELRPQEDAEALALYKELCAVVTAKLGLGPELTPYAIKPEGNK